MKYWIIYRKLGRDSLFFKEFEGTEEEAISKGKLEFGELFVEVREPDP